MCGEIVVGAVEGGEKGQGNVVEIGAVCLVGKEKSAGCFEATQTR